MQQIDVNLQKWGGVVGQNTVIHHDVEFGSEPYLISIGNNCVITKGVRFLTHDGSMTVLQKAGLREFGLGRFGRIEIGDNCFIGWNSIIMPGIKIGNNVIVGAGSIVTHNIQDNMVVAGVPAREIETIEELSKKVNEHSCQRRNIKTINLNNKEFKKCVITNMDINY